MREPGRSTTPDHAVSHGVSHEVVRGAAPRAAIDHAHDHLERTPLTRGRIVQAVVDVIDQKGITAFTMRRSGERRTSHYRYVNGREDLLGVVVDGVSGSCRGRHPMMPPLSMSAMLRMCACITS